MKGKIIVIEGTDGSGKKTQTTLLLERLKSQGKQVLVHSFPSYNLACSGAVKMYLNGEFGNNPNDVSPKQASILFAADRVATFLDRKLGLKQHLESGGVVIFDRYVYSNMIHQACKFEQFLQAEQFIGWLDNLEFNELALPRADLVVFLDMPIEFSKKLANSRQELKAGTTVDIHENNEQHLKKAYETAKKVSRKLGWAEISCVENNEIKTRQQISNEIYELVEKIV